MFDPGFRNPIRVVVHVGQWEVPQAGRQRVVPIVIGDAQRTLETDGQRSILVHLRKPKHQFVVL